VVRQAGWNDRDLVTAAVGQLADIDFWPFREWVQPVSVAKPRLPRSTGVGGDDQLGRDPAGRPKHAKQTIDGAWVWELPRLLHPGIGDVAALVLVRIVDLVEIGEGHAAALREPPTQFLFVEPRPERS